MKKLNITTAIMDTWDKPTIFQISFENNVNLSVDARFRSECKELLEYEALECIYPFTNLERSIVLSDCIKKPAIMALCVAFDLSFEDLTDSARDLLSQCAFIGEVDSKGSVYGVKGVLPMLDKLKEAGIEYVFLPESNMNETAFVKGLKFIPVTNLGSIYDMINNGCLDKYSVKIPEIKEEENFRKYEDIVGNESAKRACMIAAAGNHPLFFLGQPGCGKSMLASRLSSILPDLNDEEKKQIGFVWSAAGLLDSAIARPFRAPHHTISEVAFLGGRYPGEIHLATGGILFLDEASEFKSSNILDAAVAKKNDYLFVLASNPCSCGFYPDESRCRCSKRSIESFYRKLNILKDVDIVCGIKLPQYQDIEHRGKASELTSESMKKKVTLARNIQKARFADKSIKYNSEIGLNEMLWEEYCSLRECETPDPNGGFNIYGCVLSIRDEYKLKTIRVARTIADLEGHEYIQPSDLDEAYDLVCGLYSEDDETSCAELVGDILS